MFSLCVSIKTELESKNYNTKNRTVAKVYPFENRKSDKRYKNNSKVYIFYLV